jgi:hypothetical protein
MIMASAGGYGELRHGPTHQTSCTTGRCVRLRWLVTVQSSPYCVSGNTRKVQAGAGQNPFVIVFKK